MSKRGSKRKASDDLEYKPPRMRKMSGDVMIKEEPVCDSPIKDDDQLEHGMDVSELELEEKVEDTKPDWVEDNTVPAGWKRRIFDNNSMVHFNIPGLLAPDGMQFRSRQNALRVLTKKKADPEILSSLADCLIHEGWEEHELLPEGWRIRKQKKDFHKTKIEFLNHKSEMFKSLKETLQYMENNYDEESLRSFQSLLELSSVELRVEGYDWRPDDSVPPGWQMRLAEGPRANKEFFLSPDGKMFATRTVAMQHMIKEEYHEKEIELMREKLVEYESWQICPDLPQGWLMKDTSNFSLLTSEGDTLESWCTAIDYIKENEAYSEEDSERLLKAMEEKSKERRLEGYVWEEDDTVPEGWKSRRAQSKTEKQYFLSPQGQAFASRFVAYQHMVKEGFPQAELEEMKQFLHYEEWNDHQLLPDQWKFKRSSTKTEVHFLTERGQFMRNFKIARKHISAQYPDCLQNFELFQNSESVRRRTSGYDWTEDDPTVPEGWLIRVTEGKRRKTFLLSPDGVQYQSRRLALQSAVSENKDPQLIETLRSLLCHEGCTSSELLPENWHYQYVSENAYHIIRETGDTFESFFSALEFLRANNYSQEDVANMELFEQEMSRVRRAMLSGWKEDPNLPPGWRSRPKGGQHTNRLLFLSPSGVQFHNRLQCLQEMIASGYSSRHIQMVKDYMSQESWLEHDSLPRGWMICTIKSTKGLLLTRDGEILSSILAAKEYVSSREDYDASDLEKLSNVLEEINKLRRQNNEEFRSDPSLPENWKIKEVVNKRGRTLNFIISPEGLKFACRRLALIHMITNNFPQPDIDKMRSSMGLEGFEESDLLPPNWLIRYRPGPPSPSVHILTDFGVVFESFSLASDMMMNNPNFTEEDVAKLNKYLELQAHSRRQNYCWSSDPQLPDGWKFRIAAGKKKALFFLSPDGSMIQGRLRSCMHLLRSGDSQAAESFKRLLVSQEKWSHSDLIPTGWLFKEVRNSTKKGSHFGYRFLTREGSLHEGCPPAMDHIKSLPGYSQKDVDRLQRFLPNRQAQRHNQRGIKEEEEVKEEPVDVEVEPVEVKVEEVEREEKKRNRKSERKKDKKQSERPEKRQKKNRRQSEEVTEEVSEKGEGWTVDSSIPVSWRSRLVENKKEFLSPDGRQFRSRRTALIHLLEIAETVGEIQKMRAGFSSEGWGQEGYLPPNWWYRSSKASVSFITYYGDLLTSIKEAEEYIKQNEPEYSKMFDKFKKKMEKSH